MKIIGGDLIKLALEVKFDVIAHGVNCFCKQKSGIAKQMVKHFKTDTYHLEDILYKGDMCKLGRIDFGGYVFSGGYTEMAGENIIEGHLLDALIKHTNFEGEENFFYVVNCYTQYRYGKNHPDGDYNPLDYEALTLCMRKINHKFKGKRVGLPLIGGGLAGGEKEKIIEIMKRELKDVDLTLVLYDK